MHKIIYTSVLLVGAFGLVLGQNFGSCLQCDSGESTACIDPSAAVHVSGFMRECEQASNNTCYTRIIDRRVVRGCLFELTIENINACNTDNSTCSLCFSEHQNGCNNMLFPSHRQSCHQCTGNENSTCAAEITGQPTLCTDFEPNDRCYVRANGNIIERGCVSANVCRNDDDNCNVCDGHGCNFRVFNSSNVIVSSYSIFILSALFVLRNFLGHF